MDIGKWLEGWYAARVSSVYGQKKIYIQCSIYEVYFLLNHNWYGGCVGIGDATLFTNVEMEYEKFKLWQKYKRVYMNNKIMC